MYAGIYTKNMVSTVVNSNQITSRGIVNGTQKHKISRMTRCPRPTLHVQVADHILIFHRGIGTEQVKGLLIEEKLDLLCEYTVFWLLDYVKKLMGWGKKKGGVAEGGAGEGVIMDQVTREDYARQDSTLQGHLEGGKFIASDHKYAKVGARVPTAGSGGGWGQVGVMDGVTTCHRLLLGANTSGRVWGLWSRRLSAQRSAQRWGR